MLIYRYIDTYAQMRTRDGERISKPRAHLWQQVAHSWPQATTIHKVKAHCTRRDVAEGRIETWAFKGRQHADEYAKLGARCHGLEAESVDELSALHLLAKIALIWGALQDATEALADKPGIEKDNAEGVHLWPEEAAALKMQRDLAKFALFRWLGKLPQAGQEVAKEQQAEVNGHRLRRAIVEDNHARPQASFVHCVRCGAFGTHKKMALASVCLGLDAGAGFLKQRKRIAKGDFPNTDAKYKDWRVVQNLPIAANQPEWVATDASAVAARASNPEPQSHIVGPFAGVAKMAWRWKNKVKILTQFGLEHFSFQKLKEVAKAKARKLDVEQELLRSSAPVEDGEAWASDGEGWRVRWRLCAGGRPLAAMGNFNVQVLVRDGSTSAQAGLAAVGWAFATAGVCGKAFATAGFERALATDAGRRSGRNACTRQKGGGAVEVLADASVGTPRRADGISASGHGLQFAVATSRWGDRAFVDQSLVQEENSRFSACSTQATSTVDPSGSSLFSRPCRHGNCNRPTAKLGIEHHCIRSVFGFRLRVPQSSCCERRSGGRSAIGAGRGERWRGGQGDTEASVGSKAWAWRGSCGGNLALAATRTSATCRRLCSDAWAFALAWTFVASSMCKGACKTNLEWAWAFAKPSLHSSQEFKGFNKDDEKKASNMWQDSSRYVNICLFLVAHLQLPRFQQRVCETCGTAKPQRFRFTRFLESCCGGGLEVAFAAAFAAAFATLAFAVRMLARVCNDARAFAKAWASLASSSCRGFCSANVAWAWVIGAAFLHGHLGSLRPSLAALQERKERGK